jgi:hypothetical protein
MHIQSIVGAILAFVLASLANARHIVPRRNAALETTLTTHEDDIDLLPRQTPGGETGLFCIPVAGQGWETTSSDTITGQGIPYLNGVTNSCDVGPGPANCVRVSCSYSAVIYLCNDVSTLLATYYGV